MSSRFVMPAMSLKYKGGSEKIKNRLKALESGDFLKSSLDKYGQMGVEALKQNTPRRTGKTAESWSYKIVKESDEVVRLTWVNSNESNHVSVALLIQYGHLSKRGVWIRGIDYINPSLRPVFEKLKASVWKEVKGS